MRCIIHYTDRSYLVAYFTHGRISRKMSKLSDKNAKINMERSREKESCNLHTAVQENNFETRLCDWDYFIPFYSTFNKMNYSQYVSFYLESMKYIDVNYPGQKKCLHTLGCHVQGKEK